MDVGNVHIMCGYNILVTERRQPDPTPKSKQARPKPTLWNPLLVNFRLENQAPEAEGAGLLRLGEPLGRSRGNHRAVAATAWSLRCRVRTLLGKPS